MCATLLLISVNNANANVKGFNRLVGNVYSMDNNPAGNRLVVYGRFSNGGLVNFGSVGTGGLGAGDNEIVDPLGSQDAIVLSDDKRYLYAVNAGSDDISVFRLSRKKGRARLIQVIDSNGDFPVSLTTSGDLVYVVNAGSDGSIAGYRRLKNGRLELLENSIRTLGLGQEGIPVGQFANTFSPGNISFDTLNRRLVVVTGIGSNGEIAQGGRLLTFPLDNSDLPSEEPTETFPGIFAPSSIDFTQNGIALVTDTALGSVSSFDFNDSDFLDTVSLEVFTDPGAGVGEGATCWVRITDNGIVYATNTSIGTISSFRVARNGELTLLDSAAASALVAPTDFDITDDDEYLYVLTILGISAYSINTGTGELTNVGEFAGLPIFEQDGFAPQGLVVR
jgi:hypothetical protein